MNTTAGLLFLFVFNTLAVSKEQEIAAALLEQSLNSEILPASEFARELSTGIQTVNRFCHQLGYHNYKALTTHLERTRKGRREQICRRLQPMAPEDFIREIEAACGEVPDSESFLDKAQCLAKLIFEADTIILTGAANPLAAALGFAEDMHVAGKRVCFCHQISGCRRPSAVGNTLVIFISSTGRFLSMQKAEFIRLYDSCQTGAAISQNARFGEYEKIKAFLPLPVHEETQRDPRLFASVLDLIEYLYFKCYVPESGLQ